MNNKIKVTPLEQIIVENFDNRKYTVTINDIVYIWKNQFNYQNPMDVLRYTPNYEGRVDCFLPNGFRLDCSERYMSKFYDINYDEIYYFRKKEIERKEIYE